MYFKVILEGGHVGAGKSFEMVRYFEAENAIVLLKYLESYPALKFKSRGAGITLVKPISKEEYLLKKDLERNDPYPERKYVRFDVCEKYYPQGINDPDYSVLCFISEWANFYHGLDRTL